MFPHYLDLLSIDYASEQLQIDSLRITTADDITGSASPVLTATGFVNGRGQFLTPHRIHTP